MVEGVEEVEGVSCCPESRGNAEELRRAGGEVGGVEVALEVRKIRGLRDEAGEGRRADLPRALSRVGGEGLRGEGGMGGNAQC